MRRPYKMVKHIQTIRWQFCECVLPFYGVGTYRVKGTQRDLGKNKMKIIIFKFTTYRLCWTNLAQLEYNNFIFTSGWA